MKNLFLVSLQHGMDDVPLRIFDSRKDAYEFASTAYWHPPVDVAEALKLPDMDTPSLISIIEFEDGKPVARDVVRNYEEESELIWEDAP